MLQAPRRDGAQDPFGVVVSDLRKFQLSSSRSQGTPRLKLQGPILLLSSSSAEFCHVSPNIEYADSHIMSNPAIAAYPTGT
jgi:hypothetical protein